MASPKRKLKLSVYVDSIPKSGMKFQAMKQPEVASMDATISTNPMKKEVCDAVSRQLMMTIIRLSVMPLAIWTVFRSAVRPYASTAPAYKTANLITQYMKAAKDVAPNDQMAYLPYEKRSLCFVQEQIRGRYGLRMGCRSSFISWSKRAEFTIMLMPMKQLQSMQKSQVKTSVPEKAQSQRQKKMPTETAMFFSPKKTKKQDNRQQNHRPWCSTNLSRNRNCPILKSLTAAAELPYLPIIPTPIFASSIIPTSLPPSPIASTISPSCLFTKRTITAFSLGELRQKMTDLARVSSSAKIGEGFSSTAAICRPYMISVYAITYAVWLRTSWQKSCGSYRSAERRKTRQSW